MSEAAQEMTEAVDAMVLLLLAEGAGVGSSFHSWRCEHPDRFGKCACVEESAKEILTSPAFKQFALSDALVQDVIAAEVERVVQARERAAWAEGHRICDCYCHSDFRRCWRCVNPTATATHKETP